MSSPRTATPSDAVIVQADQPVGAVLLPEKYPESFVEEFNRTYASIGLKLSHVMSGVKEPGRSGLHPAVGPVYTTDIAIAIPS